MAVVIKASQSAEDVEKPGKISHELLHKFESDPSLARPQSLPVGHFRLSAQSFTSSSGEITTSHENLKEKKTHATLKMPETNEEHLFPASSAEEDMLSDEEAGNEKKKKKRKLRWKWSPLRKMRRLFRRRKSDIRVKSCEELPKENYNPRTCLISNGEDSDSQMNRVRSETSLLDTKTKTAHTAIEIHERKMIVGSLVGRNKSDSSEVVGKLFEDLKRVEEDITQENISRKDPTTIADERESQAHSRNSAAAGACTVVDWSYDSGTETAVSFEDVPHSSSLEGLQAAHDRIRAAPKHRRPPTRARYNSSSVNLLTNELPHRRSKTDPNDLIVKPNVESASTSESRATIFESQEVNEEQSKENVLDDLKANAENIISKPSQANNEMLTRSTKEKEDFNVKDTEKNKQGNATDNSADRELKCLKDNTNKENQTDSKKSVLYENMKEETETKDKVIELNNKNKECRPVLDKLSESVGIIEMKEPEIDCHLTEAASTEPPCEQASWTGVSLNTFESHTRKQCDSKVGTFIKGRERQGETSVCKENQSTITQSSSDCHEQTEPKVSTATGLDEKNVPVCDKGTSSVQPSWVELANQRSKRLSQLFNEGAKEADSQASLKVASSKTSANNDDNKPVPRDKVKPKVPPKKDGLTNKAKKPKPDPSSKPLYGKIDNRISIANSSGQGKVNPDKRFSAVVSDNDTCVVCGTAVYQMEKCSLDHWVLHRRCVKCTICKRLLTVGNFVMAECKVYCKPHAKAVTVSM